MSFLYVAIPREMAKEFELTGGTYAGTSFVTTISNARNAGIQVMTEKQALDYIKNNPEVVETPAEEEVAETETPIIEEVESPVAEEETVDAETDKQPAEQPDAEEAEAEEQPADETASEVEQSKQADDNE